MSGVLDRDIRVRLQYLTEGQDRAAADMKEMVAVVGELTRATNSLVAAQQRRSDNTREETNRELGLLEKLQARYRELQTAIERAASVEDIRLLNRELDKVQAEMTAIASAGRGWETSMRQANAAGKDVRGTMGGLQGDLASVRGLILQAFGAYEILQFGKGVIDARSNMESFDVSLKTMLGNKEKADKLAADLVKFAQQTPFELKDLQGMTAKLLAFGFSASEIIPTLTQLGDIAAGVGRERLPFLTLALGQTRTATVLTGEELRQFVENGVPLIEELAKVTGHSIAAITSETKDLGITYQQVQQALQNLTGEGGRFNNLMALQSKTMGGMISNLSDAYYQAKARIGEYIESGLKPAIEWGTRLMNNLAGNRAAVEKLADYVKAGVTAWIAYRTAGSATATALAAKELVMKALTLTTGTYNLALVTARGTTEGFTRAQLASAVAARGLWTALASNPLGAVIAVVGVAVSAYLALRDAQSEVGEGMDENTKKIFEERNRLQTLVGAIVNTNDNYRIRKGLLAQLRQEYPDFLKGIDDENVSNRTLLNLLGRINLSYQERITLARTAYNVEKNTNDLKKVWDDQRNAVELLKKEFKELKIESMDLDEAVQFVKKSGVDTWVTLNQGMGQYTRIDRLASFVKVLEDTGKRQTALTNENIKAEQQAETMRAQFSKNAELRHEQDVKREKELHALLFTRAGSGKVVTVQMVEEYNTLKAANDAWKVAHTTTTNTIVENEEKKKKAAKSSLEVQLESDVLKLKSAEKTWESEYELIKKSAELDIEQAKRAAKDKELTAKQLSERIKAIKADEANKLLEVDRKYVEDAAKDVGKWLDKLDKDRKERLKGDAAYLKDLEKQIQDAQKDTHREQVEQQKILFESRKKNFAIVLDFLSRESELVGEIGRAAKIAWENLDLLTGEKLNAAKEKLAKEGGVLSSMLGSYDGTKEMDVQIEKQKANVAALTTNVKDLDAAGQAAMLSVVSMAITTWLKIGEAYEEMMARTYQAIADSLGKARQALNDFYNQMIDQSRQALAEELENFEGTYDQKAAIIEAHYAEQKQLMDLRDQTDAMLGAIEDVNQAAANAGKNGRTLIEGMITAYTNSILREQQARLNQVEWELQKAAELRDAKIRTIDEAFKAFKEATEAEMDLAKRAAEEKKALIEQQKADETEAIEILDRVRNEALERYRRDEVARLQATRDRILATLTDEDEKRQVIEEFDRRIKAVHDEVEEAKLDKSKGVSLATKQLEQEEKDFIERLEQGLKDTISALQEQIKQQEINAAREKANANNDYKNAYNAAQREMFEITKQMKIAELQAEIAILRSKRNLFNRGKIDAAIGDLNAAIGQIAGLTFGAPTPTVDQPTGGPTDILPPDQGTDTQIFHDGTENVRTGRGYRRGSFIAYDEVPAILQTEERVVNRAQNKRLGGISNEQLVRMVEAYRGGSSVHYKPIDLSGFGPVGQATDMGPMLQKMDALRDALEKQPQFHANFDERGMSISQRKGLAKTNYRNNRFWK
jgi:tape measure domain-containing protein